METTRRTIPLVIGHVYLKVENFDLDELSVIYIFILLYFILFFLNVWHF